jgi:hypothetical protein
MSPLDYLFPVRVKGIHLKMAMGINKKGFEGSRIQGVTCLDFLSFPYVDFDLNPGILDP